MTGDMSTGPGLPTPGHAAFDELTVGYALDALEPGEEAVLLKHLPSCRRCQASLSTHREIAAELALAFADDDGVDAEVPVSDALAEAMGSKPHRLPVEPFPVVVSESERVAGVGLVPEQPRRTGSLPRIPVPATRSGERMLRQARRVLVGAGALGIIAAVSLSAYDVHLRRESPTTTGQAAALSALADDPNATIAHLGGSGVDAVASASAVVAGGHAWLVATGLKQTTTDASYVVWDLRNGKVVKPLASFSGDSTSAPQVVKLGAVPTRDESYAVTLEPQSVSKPLPSVAHGTTVLTEFAEGSVPVAH